MGTAKPVAGQAKGHLRQKFKAAMSNLALAPDAPARLTLPERDAMFARVVAAMQAGDQEGALDEALALVQEEPWERRYLLALAACLHHVALYEPAVQIYGLAYLLDATDALCAYRMGECLGALNDLDDARDAFESAIRLSALDTHRYGEVRIEAERRLDELSGLGH